MPYTLLLADDSVTVHKVIELTFAGEDFKVVAVSDGDAALARLEAAPPDIALVDVGMPGKNGYEIAQYMKRSDRLSHIPVVLLTGVFEPVDEARVAESGCNAVLSKPFEPRQVVKRVKELLPPAGVQPAWPESAAAAVAAPEVPTATPPPIEFPAPELDGGPVIVEPAESDISDYFDRLDAAFANLPSATFSSPPPVSAFAEPASTSAAPPSPSQPVPSADGPRSIADEIDWFATHAAPRTQELPDLPLSHASASDPPVEKSVAPAQPPVEESAAPSGQPEPQPEPLPAASLAQRPVSLPPLADAFAALLAAEQGSVAMPLTWPATAPSDDTFADQVSRRVLEQLTARVDGVVRTAVAELVSQVAERLIREEADRLIREEIERIKSSIESAEPSE